MDNINAMALRAKNSPLVSDRLQGDCLCMLWVLLRRNYSKVTMKLPKLIGSNHVTTTAITQKMAKQITVKIEQTLAATARSSFVFPSPAVK